MSADSTLARYRMTITLATALLGPTAMGLLLGLAGMTSAPQLGTITQLVVWAVGLWAFGCVGWELYRGVGRYRQAGDSETAETATAP